MKRPKVLIFGAGGKIGHHVARTLSATCDVTPLVRHAMKGKPARSCDITDEGAVAAALATIKPDVVVNLAAMADAATCQAHPHEARKINIHGAKSVAHLSADCGARLIHYSTDLVFDGEKGNYCETDQPNPLTLYAETKLASEQVTLEAHPGAVVIRTAITYGSANALRPDFFAFTLQQVRKGKEVNLFTDQYRSFLYVDDSARALAALIKTNCAGIYHLAGPERMSRHAFTLAALTRLGERTDTLRPLRMAAIASKVTHCADCSLEGSRMRKETGFTPGSLEKAMQHFKKRSGEQGETK